MYVSASLVLEGVAGHSITWGRNCATMMRVLSRLQASYDDGNINDCVQFKQWSVSQDSLYFVTECLSLFSIAAWLQQLHGCHINSCEMPACRILCCRPLLVPPPPPPPP